MYRSNLKILIAQRRIRLTDVAEATGLDRTRLSKIANDRAQRFSLEEIDVLSQYFETCVFSMQDGPMVAIGLFDDAEKPSL